MSCGVTGRRLPHRFAMEQRPAPPFGTHAVGDDPLIRALPEFYQHRARPVAEQWVGLDVRRVQHAAVFVVAADDQGVRSGLAFTYAAAVMSRRT